jgi:hypothetical protein
MLTTKIMVPDHRFAASMPLRRRAIAPSRLFCNVDVARQFAVNYDLNRRASVKFFAHPLRIPERGAVEAYPPLGKEAEEI